MVHTSFQCPWILPLVKMFNFSIDYSRWLTALVGFPSTQQVYIWHVDN